MSEHSKSPWKASKPHKISNRKFKCIMSVGESVLAFVFGNSKKETETNAHLISAAPDMYEALVKAHDLLLCLHVCNEDQHRADKLRASLKDIILKAEGKS